MTASKRAAERSARFGLVIVCFAIANVGLSTLCFGDSSGETINVVVWDEQQPGTKHVYENFLGNQIADYLKSRPGLSVQSVKLDDPEQGLSKEILDRCQVLIYWGHARHQKVKRETGQDIVRRIKSGQLSMIPLHSAQWSRPFTEAMNEVTRQRAESQFAGTDEKVEFNYVKPTELVVPKASDQLTPRVEARKYPNGVTKVTVHLPNCAFPRWREDGKPSYLRTLKPDHPIAKGIPRTFTLPATEMYDEPFHVPVPDEVIFEERWEGGEWFRSTCVWNLGQGKVVYVRPGHETYPIYKDKNVLRIIENAVRWLAGR